jgi:hypothetical protein
MSTTDHPYWTPSNVLSWLRKHNPGISVEHTIDELRDLCKSGRLRSWWKATHTPEGALRASDTFELIPPERWLSISFSLKDGMHFSDKVHSAGLPRGVNVEVQFSRDDVQRELLRPVAARPPQPFWDDARQIALTWLDDNGFPQPGDGGQAKLERHITDWLFNRGHNPAESTIRKYVSRWIQEHKKGLGA